MSAQENKRSIIVGIFVLVGVVLLVAGIITLGGQQNRFARTVTVSATFSDVGGLKAGNNVWFSGVKIGTVKSINFVNVQEVEVTMAIEEKSRGFIRKDALAKLSSEGFIGNRLVVIEGGSAAAPPISEGDRLQSGPSSDTDAMMATLQTNNENLVGITENFQILTEQLVKGEGTIGALLTERELFDEIKQLVANLNQTVANTSAASEELVRLTSQFNKEGTLVNDLLTDTVIYANLQTAVAQLQGVTQTATALTTNLNEATAKLNDNDNAVGLLLNDPQMAEQIQRTMENLEQSTEKLDQNMEALQHNFLLRGFFRKKAREEARAGEN